MKTFQTLEKLESFLPIYSSQAALGSCIPPREGGNQVQDAGPPGWGGRGLGCAEGEPNAGCPPRWRAGPPPALEDRRALGDPFGAGFGLSTQKTKQGGNTSQLLVLGKTQGHAERRR